ncbi:UNVERIFIED_CONTAM: hypothetical protein RMT77_008220 [Armadillidium vulgare]
MKLKRLKTGKANRWKKGYSCASNPTNTKFRQAAKNHFFPKSEGESNLTVEALAKHTAALSVEPQLCANSDDDMTIGRTFNTFATNFTTCTVPAFERFFRNFSANSDLQKHMLAIHAAAQQYIQNEKLPETSTSYMCAFMASLEGIKGIEMDVAATLSLLAKVIRKVSIEVLRAKFDEYSKLFLEILNTYSETNNVRVVNNVIGCLSILLRAQTESQWTYESTLHLFQNIICFSTHENADIRRSAQYNVSAILRGSSFMNTCDNLEEMEVSEDLKMKKQTVTFHPASHIVGKFILTNLKLATQNKNGNATLYLLIFLQVVIHSLPEKKLEECCAKVLGVMHIGDAVVNSRSLKVFGTLFSTENDKHLNSALTKETVEALINALTSNSDTQSSKSLKLVPSMNKPELCTVWMSVVSSGIVLLYKKNRSEGINQFKNWVEQLVSYWKSDFGTVHEKVWYTFDFIFDECIKPLGEDVSSYSEELLHCFMCVEKYLSFQFDAAWPYVFRTLGLFFSILGQHFASEMLFCLKDLACKASQSDINGKKELEAAIGSALLGMGPERVMSVVDLQISGEIKEDETHFWILPLLKKFVKNCRLSFFVSFFIPLTNKCFLLIKRLKEKGKGNSLLAKTYKQVECQIWSLLPSFADGATDIKEVLRTEVPSVNPEKDEYANLIFAELIGKYIKCREDTRLEFLSCLRNLLKSSSSSTTMARFSKNFLSILFNVYLMKPRQKFPNEPPADLIDSGQRLAAFTTIKCYLPIVPANQLSGFFDLIMKKHNDKSSDMFKRKSLMNLGMLFVPYVSTEIIFEMYRIAKENLQSQKSELHKASYRVLEDIIVANTDSTNAFIQERLEEICILLFSTSKNVAPNARAPRVKCLSKLLPYLQEDISDERIHSFFKHLVGEAIEYCGRTNSTATRKAGYTLIRDIGAAIQRIQKISFEDTFDYIMDLLPSFTPIRDSTANVIYVLTILHFMYDDVQTPKIVKISVPYIATLLSCGNKYVITSCLSFIRVSFSRCLPVGISDFVDIVVKNIVDMPSHDRLKFRRRIRDILSSLIRKFGGDRIKELVPEQDPLQKVITNLIKTDKRKKKKKMEQEKEDSDSEYETVEEPVTLDQVLHQLDEEIENDDEPGASKHKNKRQMKSAIKTRKQTWIREDEDEIIDFLDVESSHKITSKMPREKKLRFADDVPPQTDEEKYGFKFDKSCNKFIIKENWRDKEKRNWDDVYDDEQMALDDIIGMKKESKVPQTTQKKRKRNLSDSSDDSDDSDEWGEPAAKYQTGPSIDERKKIKNKFDYGSEFKSKKAGGDIVKKGGHAPYAYVQFSKDKLNKRKSAKYAGQFKSLVKGAKKGAVKGGKSRGRRR